MCLPSCFVLPPCREDAIALYVQDTRVISTKVRDEDMGNCYADEVIGDTANAKLCHSCPYKICVRV